MNSDLLKLLAPAVFFVMWLYFVLRHKSNKLAGVSFFFTSIVAFSQNFAFIYREIHQLIQIVLILPWAYALIRNNKIHKFNCVFFILLIFIGLSLIFSIFDQDARAQLINLVAAICVTNYLFSKTDTEQSMRVLMLFVAQLAIALSLIGLFEYVTNISPRIEGTFANPNYFAFFLGIGWCFAFQATKGIFKKLSLTLILTAIILSGSRIAIVFPLLQVLWYAYRLKGLKYFIGYGVFVVAFLSVVILSGVSRFSKGEASEGSDAERVIFAIIAYRMANDHPLSGVGWGRFATEFSAYSSAAEAIIVSGGIVDVSGQDRRVTHNDYMRILAELGWVAFFSALLSLVIAASMIVKNKDVAFDYIFPVWFGTVLFSATHNNLNGALFWFFFLMPFYYLRPKSSLNCNPSKPGEI
jgi:O-antigen ligase